MLWSEGVSSGHEGKEIIALQNAGDRVYMRRLSTLKAHEIEFPSLDRSARNLVHPLENSSGQLQYGRSSSGNPDFSGVWRIERIDGDMEAFMTDHGIGWWIRKRARLKSYDEGTTIRIGQNGARVEFEQSAGNYTVLVGGGWQHYVDVVSAGQMKPYWAEDGNALIAETQALDGSMPGQTKRYFPSSDINVHAYECTSCNGARVRYTLRRQDS